jgi:outer membrane receptor for ferrienterochelin and colicins|tara:strand:- start:95 stop:2206 length:2112 start_codon:yes stop_codon:yes gene_type:complete
VLVFIFILTASWATTLTGHVKNNVTGKSIPNANIIIREIDQGTASNPYGYFELNLSKGTYTLETSVLGFKTDSREIIIDENNIELNIDLQTAMLEFREIQVQGLFTTRLGSESVDVINSDKIKSMDKESVSDILRDIPGVDVQFAHPNGRNVNISIRGSSDYKPGGYNNRVLVLLDGFPILIPNSGSPDWNSLPLESIQRIEVDNSPASAQYGHNSMGGVINLITDHNGTDNNTILRLSGGANTTGQISLTHRKKKGDWAYGINTMVRSSEGHRFNADDKIARIRTYLRYGDNKGRSYRLSHILSYSDIGHPGFISSPSYRRSDRLTQYIQGHGFYPITNGLSMSHSIFLNKFDTHYYPRNNIPDDYTDIDQTYYDDLTVGFRSEMLITKWARWIIMAGSDVDWSQSDVDVFNSMYGAPSQLSVGGFIQSKYSIGNGWNFGSGLRYDYRRSNPGGNYQKRIYTHLSPKINIMYTSRGKRAFTLAYSEGFRAPSLSELYLYYESSYGLITKGNPELTPEEVKAVELTYEHPHSDAWYWSISLFHNRYENMIDFIYAIPVLSINREGVTGMGGEFQFKWKPIDTLTFRGSYAYLDMTDRGGAPILYRSKHRGQVNVRYQAALVNIQLGIQAWSKQIYEDFLSGSHFDFPIRELPERIIPELILSREVNGFTGSLHITNLFDTKYELIQDFPMPGRSWQFNLTKTL